MISSDANISDNFLEGLLRMPVVMDNKVIPRADQGLVLGGMVVDPVTDRLCSSLGREIPRIQLSRVIGSDGADGAVFSRSRPDSTVDLEGIEVFLAFAGGVVAQV